MPALPATAIVTEISLRFDNAQFADGVNAYGEHFGMVAYKAIAAEGLDPENFYMASVDSDLGVAVFRSRLDKVD